MENGIIGKTAINAEFQCKNDDDDQTRRAQAIRAMIWQRETISNIDTPNFGMLLRSNVMKWKWAWGEFEWTEHTCFGDLIVVCRFG